MRFALRGRVERQCASARLAASWGWGLGPSPISTGCEEVASHGYWCITIWMDGSSAVGRQAELLPGRRVRTLSPHVRGGIQQPNASAGRHHFANPPPRHCGHVVGTQAVHQEAHGTKGEHGVCRENSSIAMCQAV